MLFYAARFLICALIVPFALNAKVADLRYIKNSLAQDQKAVVKNIENIDPRNLQESLVKLLVSVPEMPKRPQLEDYKKVKTTARLKNAEVIVGNNGAGGAYKDNVRTNDASVSIEYDHKAHNEAMTAYQEKYAAWQERYYLARDILRKVKDGDLENLQKINEMRPDLNLAQKKSSLVQFLKDAAYTAQAREHEAKVEQRFETTSPRLESWYRYYTKCAVAWGALAVVGAIGIIYGGQEYKVAGGTAAIVGAGAAAITLSKSSDHIHHYEHQTENARSNIELIKKFENLQF